MMQNMIQQMIISTHSLTRRLTSLQVMSKSFGRNFNSQPHKEADGKTFSVIPLDKSFQLTASQGG